MTSTSVQLYSVRDAFAEDAVGTLTRLRDIGFDAVEPYALMEFEATLARALPASGLAAPSAHASLVSAPDVGAVLDAAERLGIGTVIEPSVREDAWGSADAVARTAERLGEIAALAAPRGITIGYHNHWWEFADFDGRTGLELFAEVADPSVVLEVDVYWVQTAGVPVADLIEALTDRVRFLHVKDGPATRDTSAQLPAGRGAIALDAALEAAPGAVRVVEFDAYGGDVFEGLAESLAWLDAREAVRP